MKVGELIKTLNRCDPDNDIKIIVHDILIHSVNLREKKMYCDVRVGGKWDGTVVLVPEVHHEGQ